MASKTGAVWAIDIGNNSIKTLHLTAERGVVEVIGFDNIQHGKVLTGVGVKPAERSELVALSLREFVSKYDLSKDELMKVVLELSEIIYTCPVKGKCNEILKLIEKQSGINSDDQKDRPK